MRTNLVTKNTSSTLAALFVFVICLPGNAQAACTPKGAAELNRQGLELVKKKENADAMIKFSAALDCYPNNPEYKKHYSMTWFVTASQVFDGGNYETAIAFFKNALAADPSNKEARDALAIAEKKLKEQGAAGGIQQSPPPIGPIPGIGAAQPWQPPRNASESERKAAKENEIGIREFDNGEYVYAAAAFERALMLDPKNSVYRRNRAKSTHGIGRKFLAAGNYFAAVTTLKSAHNDDPANENIRADRAIAETKLNEANTKEASRIALEGDAIAVLGVSGGAGIRPNDNDGAIAKYREALKIDPSLRYARHQLGMVLSYKASVLGRRGDLADAIAAYREAAALYYDWYGVYKSVRSDLARYEAEYAIKMGDLKTAIQKYGEALVYKPTGEGRRFLLEVQVKLATAEGQALLKSGDSAGAEAKSAQIIALKARSDALSGVIYSASQSKAPRLSEFNVLRLAYLDPRTGNVTLVGDYDAVYQSGPIPYYDLLADALQNPYPVFSLVLNPNDPALRRIKQTIDAEMDHVRRDDSYGGAWLKRLLMPALDRQVLTDEQALLQERLSRLDIPIDIDAFAAYLAWDHKSGLQDAVFREKIGLVTAKLLRAAGIEERIGYAVIGLTELGLAIEAKAHGRPPGDKEQLGDKTLRIFQSLEIESEFYRIQEAQRTGRLTHTQEWVEVLATIYGGLLRGLEVPESEVASLAEGFRAGRIREEVVTGRLNSRYHALVGQTLWQNIFNGFHFSSSYLSKMYSFAPVMSHLKLFGSRPDSPIMKAFFNGDYALKYISQSATCCKQVPEHMGLAEYLSLAEDRAGSATGQVPASGFVRLWIHPGEVNIDAFPDGSGIRFNSAKVQIGVEPMETETGSDSKVTEFYQQTLNDYAKKLTTAFDDHAHWYPALHVVRETEKVIALARWIKSRKGPVIAPEAKQSRDPLPQSVEGFWGLTSLVKTAGENVDIYLGVSGGVSFDKQEGDDWIQIAPNVQATDDVLHQLAASTAFAQQAADKAIFSGDLDAARDLAEKSAQAMTGQIDRTKLPQLPTPQFTPATAENTIAARMDVARAAVTAVDQNIRAIRQAKQDQNKAAPLRIPSPEQYQQAVEAAEKVRLRSERNLKHLNDLLAQYGLRPGDPATVATALRNLDPNAPEVESIAGPRFDLLGAQGQAVDSQIMELQSELIRLRAKIPPPISEADVSLEWTKISAPGKKVDYLYMAADGLILAFDLGGKIGSKAVPAVNLILIAGKAFIAGEDAADVYIMRRDKLIDEGLQYLRDPDTARRFAEVLQKMKSGAGTISVSDVDMIPAARAILESKNHTQIVWDAMMSPEARAAMVRKATIDLAIYYTNEALTKNLAQRAELFQSHMQNREKIQQLALKTFGNGSIKNNLADIFKFNNENLSLLYKLQVAPTKIAQYLGSIVLESEVMSIPNAQ